LKPVFTVHLKSRASYQDPPIAEAVEEEIDELLDG
jgi:hypothetical protein